MREITHGHGAHLSTGIISRPRATSVGHVGRFSTPPRPSDRARGKSPLAGLSPVQRTRPPSLRGNLQLAPPARRVGLAPLVRHLAHPVGARHFECRCRRLPRKARRRHHCQPCRRHCVTKVGQAKTQEGGRGSRLGVTACPPQPGGSRVGIFIEGGKEKKTKKQVGQTPPALSCFPGPLGLLDPPWCF